METPEVPLVRKREQRLLWLSRNQIIPHAGMETFQLDTSTNLVAVCRNQTIPLAGMENANSIDLEFGFLLLRRSARVWHKQRSSQRNG